MEKLKEFRVVYNATVKRTATIWAADREQAVEAFEFGNYEDDTETDLIDIELIKIEEEES